MTGWGNSPLTGGFPFSVPVTGSTLHCRQGSALRSAPLVGFPESPGSSSNCSRGSNPSPGPRYLFFDKQSLSRTSGNCHSADLRSPGPTGHHDSHFQYPGKGLEIQFGTDGGTQHHNAGVQIQLPASSLVQRLLGPQTRTQPPCPPGNSETSSGHHLQSTQRGHRFSPFGPTTGDGSFSGPGLALSGSTRIHRPPSYITHLPEGNTCKSKVYGPERGIRSPRKMSRPGFPLRHCSPLASLPLHPSPYPNTSFLHHQLPGFELPQVSHQPKPLRPLHTQRSPPTCRSHRYQQPGPDDAFRSQDGINLPEIHRESFHRQEGCNAPLGGFTPAITSTRPPPVPPPIRLSLEGRRRCDTSGISLSPERVDFSLHPHSPSLTLLPRSLSRRSRATRAASKRVLASILGAYPKPLPLPPLPYKGLEVDLVPSDTVEVEFAPSSELEVEHVPSLPSSLFLSKDRDIPLDRIDVPALNIRKLIDMDESLRSVLAPIMDMNSFSTLCLPESPLPRHAPTSILAGNWEDNLVDWGIASWIRKWDAKAMMKAFAVPKADGISSRFILDASSLNSAMQSPPHFRLTTLAELRPIVFSHSWAQITDLRHCFYQFPLDDEVALFFCLRSKKGHLCFRRMAMGWSWAPFLAQSTALAYLKPLGTSAIAIYDDFLILGDSMEQCSSRSSILRSRISACNGTIHSGKSDPDPKERVTFMGLEFDLPTKCHRLDPKFVSKWFPWLSALARGLTLPLKLYWVAFGVATYIQRSLLLPPAQTNNLSCWAAAVARRLSSSSLTWSSPVTPWQSASRDLFLITGILSRNAWVQFFPSPTAAPRLYTDSSLSGWAWLLHLDPHPPLLGFYGGWHPGPHINQLELLTIWKALRWLCPRLPGYTWNIMCDNATVVHQLRRGRAPNPFSNRILSDIAFLLQSTRSQVRPDWVSTINQLADCYTRLHPDPDASPSPLGLIPDAYSGPPNHWPSLLNPHLSATHTARPTSPSGVPLGFLPTGL